MPRPLACLAFALALASAVLPGCGGSGRYVWVTGTLLKGGAPYRPPEGQDVTLTFVGMEVLDEKGGISRRPDQYQANLDDTDGSFKVLGPEGSGIPPGKYRVSISVRYNREAFEALKNRPKTMIRDDDLLKDKFGPMSSPIIREVKAGSNLVIDMDKPTAMIGVSTIQVARNGIEER